MMAHYFKIGLTVVFGLSIFVGSVFAQSISDITYPIGELGGCDSQSACREYCNELANQDACSAFAAAHGLIKESSEDVRHLDSEKKGPGGCDSETACKAYCDDPAHTEECISFAEREGYMTGEEAERAREFLKKRGSKFEGPGGCKEEKECRAYCEGDGHFEECMNFAEKEGLMKPEEIERARKFHNQTGPGGCKGEACKDYCDVPGHEEECLEFAEKEDLLPKEEIQRAKKFLNASKEGGPGGCKGRECENYCNSPEHRDECFEFAKKNNLISEEELVHIERGRTLEAKVKESGGPGGCKEEKSCMEYCRDPAHVEECLGFTAAHGGMNTQEAERMLKQFVEQSGSSAGGFGPHPVGEVGGLYPIEGDIDARMEKFKDFEKLEREFRGRPGEFKGPQFPEQGDRLDENSQAGRAPEGFKGLGGCSSPDECMKYCLGHREECNLLPQGRPFEGEGFRPEGKPFEGGEPQPENAPRSPEGDFKSPDGGFRSPEGDFRPPEGFQPGGNFEEQYKQQYQQEYQKQHEQQFQEQYQQQQPATGGEPAPTYESVPSEPAPQPPAAIRRVVEAFANILFAPVTLIETLLRK